MSHAPSAFGHRPCAFKPCLVSSRLDVGSIESINSWKSGTPAIAHRAFPQAHAHQVHVPMPSGLTPPFHLRHALTGDQSTFSPPSPVASSSHAQRPCFDFLAAFLRSPSRPYISLLPSRNLHRLHRQLASPAFPRPLSSRLSRSASTASTGQLSQSQSHRAAEPPWTSRRNRSPSRLASPTSPS